MRSWLDDKKRRRRTAQLWKMTLAARKALLPYASSKQERREAAEFQANWSHDDVDSDFMDRHVL